MSNDIGARSVETYGGWFGEFRHIDESRWHRVARNGVDQIYPTAFEAECMAWRALKAKFFGVIRSEGVGRTTGRSEAERLFGQIFQKGRTIPVERV